MAKDKLTPKQKRFCEEYIIDLNGTKAAIRAGYSKYAAQQISSENMLKPLIADFIKELQDKLSKDTQITAQMVLNELAKVGFSNIQDYIKEGFTIADIQKLTSNHAAAIESISVENTQTQFGVNEKIKFKLHDKLAALDKIGKHIGFFKEDNNQSATTIKIVRE